MFERHRDGAWMSLGLTLNSFQFSNPHSYNTLRQPIIMIKKSRNDFWFRNANAIEWWRWFHRIVRLPWRVTDGLGALFEKHAKEHTNRVLWNKPSVFLFYITVLFFEVSSWSLSSCSIFCAAYVEMFSLYTAIYIIIYIDKYIDLVVGDKQEVPVPKLNQTFPQAHAKLQ
jgi:hypothetical protein